MSEGQVQSALEEYVVDKGLCIDCNACYTSYPEVFKQVGWQGETKAEAHAPVATGKYNPWDIVLVCPVDAIAKIGEMPPKPEKGATEELPPLEDQGPWEERWAAVKHLKDSQWEIMKRYGMAATVADEAKRYVIKMEFPQTTPIHILKYQMGLPDKMPDYEYKVELRDDQQTLVIAAWLKDPHVKKICGKINSFPDRFRRVFKVAHPVKISRERYSLKTLMVELTKL